MQARARFTAVALALAFFLPLASGVPTTHAEREVKALVASPSPWGPLTALDDSTSWRVEVPEGVVVCVDAIESGAALFDLRATHDGPSLQSPTPALRQSLLLPGPDTWTLTVDPVAGAEVDVHVMLDGHFVDCPNGPASFTITDLPRPPPCVGEAGACLP